MAQLHSVVQYLDSLLQSRSFDDVALNGLQVEAGAADIRRVAVAVDAGQSVLESAVQDGAQLLIVHHGLFWGSPTALTGPFGAKVEYLFRNRCSLYASHLPLDAHREVGNAFELGRFMDLGELEGFFEYRGVPIGARGKLAKGKAIEYFVDRAKEMVGASTPVILPFGRKEIRTVGIVTGSGASAIGQCVQANLDLLISGEPKQEAYHLAREHRLNVIFAGHYATETFGVRALGERIRKDFDIPAVFIDQPTGI